MDEENLTKLTEAISKLKEDFCSKSGVNKNNIQIFIINSYLYLLPNSEEGEYADRFCTWLDEEN